MDSTNNVLFKRKGSYCDDSRAMVIDSIRGKNHLHL